MAGCSPYSHSSDANPIIPLMKSGCAANEITLQQAARLHSAAALSIGPAVLVGSLRREPPRATPAARAPGPCHSGPRPATKQKGAEGRMALNKTLALGFQVPDFPVPCQHGGCSPRVLGGHTASAEPSSGDGLPRPCGTDAQGGSWCLQHSRRLRSQLRDNAANECLPQISREASQHPGPGLSGTYS